MTRTLSVIEIFNSPQGEGVRVGEPSTFIRFAGCNLRCSWCDTPYSWTPEGVDNAAKMPVDEIVEQVGERAVVLTGGEPMLWADRLMLLIPALREAGVEHITIETNATILEEEVLPLIDLWSLSPKLPGSGEEYRLEIIEQYLDQDGIDLQLKFVVADIDRDWPALTQLLGELGSKLTVPVIVQPDGLRDDYDDALRELSECLMADDMTLPDGRPVRSLIRVIPQTHRVAWGKNAVGV